jgi:hypothetical protein
VGIIGMALKLYWDAKQQITVVDWRLIEAYLVENERLFGIAVEDL